MRKRRTRISSRRRRRRRGGEGGGGERREMGVSIESGEEKAKVGRECHGNMTNCNAIGLLWRISGCEALHMQEDFWMRLTSSASPRARPLSEGQEGRDLHSLLKAFA